MILHVMMVLVSIAWGRALRQVCFYSLSLLSASGWVYAAYHDWRVLINLLDQGVVFFLDRRRLLFFPERNQLCSIIGRSILPLPSRGSLPASARCCATPIACRKLNAAQPNFLGSAKTSC